MPRIIGIPPLSSAAATARPQVCYGCLDMRAAGAMATLCEEHVAIGETVILLHLPLHLVGVSIGIKRGCQQNDCLADG